MHVKFLERERERERELTWVTSKEVTHMITTLTIRSNPPLYFKLISMKPKITHFVFLYYMSLVLLLQRLTITRLVLYFMSDVKKLDRHLVMSASTSIME